MILKKVNDLIEHLNINGVRYCHWKSNLSLEISLSGDTDIDLLIHREDAHIFRTILGRLDFRPAFTDGLESFPAMEHYFALDDITGKFIHVHAYYRVITGESLAKNYRFPLEEMLLQNIQTDDVIKVPIKNAELVLFVLRIMLKHTSLVELMLLARDWDQVTKEIDWLLGGASIDGTLLLLNDWLPSINSALFTECITALKKPANLFRRIILAHKLRKQIRIYTRYKPLKAWWTGNKKFSLMFLRRVFHFKNNMIFVSGGAVVAFVGPEATGKSTLLTEVKKWLGEYFPVEQIHVGKPKSTLLTFLPNLLVPFLRNVLPTHRSSKVAVQYNPKIDSEVKERVYPLSFAIRSVLLAYDRKILLTRAYRQAANGKIILCDRYPYAVPGAPDSPQLSKYPISHEKYPIRYWLANLEEKLYNEIPLPDLVISLTVPIEVAIVRNKNRGKEEPEDYVRFRHTQSTNLTFSGTKLKKIDTNQPLENTILDIKKAIWIIL